jgi:S1/P1 Nuclease
VRKEEGPDGYQALLRLNRQRHIWSQSNSHASDNFRNTYTFDGELRKPAFDAFMVYKSYTQPMVRAAALAVGLLLSGGLSEAFAWGCDGHQAVAFIAERLLSPASRKAVDSLLAASPVDQAIKAFCPPVPGDPLVDASTWADDYRSSTPATGSWHFINFPLAVGSRTANYKAYCPAGNCVIDAIVTQYRVLTTGANAKMKADALRFIVHFVGDLHQPLHATTNGDRGGNCLPVTFFGEAPVEDDRHNFRPNLHSVWDDGAIRHLMEAQRLTNSRALADYIAKVSPLRSVSAQAASASLVSSWARDADALARTVAYGRLPVKAALEPASALTLSSCADNNNVGQRMASLHEQLAETYQRASEPVILSQIRLAGERLAAVLKAAFPS